MAFSVQNCRRAFLEKEETSVSTVYYTAEATECQPWWTLHAGGPVFWLVDICYDGLRNRTDPWVSFLDRLSAEFSLGGSFCTFPPSQGMPPAQLFAFQQLVRGCPFLYFHFPACIFLFFVFPSRHLPPPQDQVHFEFLLLLSKRYSLCASLKLTT